MGERGLFFTALRVLGYHAKPPIEVGTNYLTGRREKWEKTFHAI